MELDSTRFEKIEQELAMMAIRSELAEKKLVEMTKRPCS
jgi:hypothetical protein